MNSLPQHKLRAIISGGGTGGHVFPAIAIANKLKETIPEAEILFIGAKGRMEMEKVPVAGYEIKGLWISGLQRKLTLKNLSFPFKVFKSLADAFFIIRRFRPDVVIGVGGYASGPTLFAASLMGIPTIIQEQNSFPGITNRLLAKRVDRICVAYEGLDRFFPAERIRMTGNPTRDEMVSIEGKREPALEFFGFGTELPILLVIGGSLGARTINLSIDSSLRSLVDIGLQVIWQTGSGYFAEASERVREFDGRVRVFAFIKEMDLAYAAADIVVSRAGAIAVSELCLVGKPVILVPSPNVAEDHQSRNAMALVKKDAAILVKDSQAPEMLGNTVLALLADEGKRKELSRNIQLMASPDAASGIVDEILALLKGRAMRPAKRKEDGS